MSDRANDAMGHEAVVRRIAAEIWNAGDPAIVDEVMAAEAAYHGPHMPDGRGGREDWRNAIAMYRGAFPDAHAVFDALVLTKDVVVGRWTATGTHTGQLPGVVITGRATPRRALPPVPARAAGPRLCATERRHLRRPRLARGQVSRNPPAVSRAVGGAPALDSRCGAA